MADINTIIEEAQLMKQNRVDLVKALNEIGFTQVNDQTPLSDIAKYMKWAAGLLDIRLATFSKSTKQHRYWTYDEWVGQSAQTRSFYIQMGVVIRAERQEFIIAKDNLTSDSGSTAMQWATNNNNDVRGLTNFYGVPTMLTDIDGEANTDLILAAIEANGIDYPAARRAREYRCCSLADGGVDDPTIWSLAAIGQLWLFYKYIFEINAALTLFGMVTIDTGSWYWSSTECNSSNAWYVYMSYGYINNNNKTNTGRARAVAPARPSSAI